MKRRLSSKVVFTRVCLAAVCLLALDRAPGMSPDVLAQQSAPASDEAPLLEATGPASATVERQAGGGAKQPPVSDAAQAATEITSQSDAAAITTGEASGSYPRPPVTTITNISYLAANRPSWVETGTVYDGDLVKVAVRGGPYRTVRDCVRDLEHEIQLAVADYTNEHLEAEHAAKFVSFSLKELRSRNIVHEEFSEQLETSLGLMNQVHAQLVFDPQFRKELDRRWGEIKSASRLAQAGLGTGIVLLLLGTLFSFLKLDTATKGYYTGRLQFGAAATILALVAASVVLMKWIPWM